MSTVRKSILISFAENYSALIIQFVSTMILARLLTPAQIGVFSVAAVAVALAHTVRDFGVGQYIIQEKELTAERIRAAFGLAIVTAWSMAAVLFAISEPFAAFYKEPGITEVMHLLAINFLLLPFSTVALALWRRDMNFTQPYIIKTSGTVIHAITAIWLAHLGFGYLSMAWAAVASIACMSIISYIHRPPRMPWLPGFREWRRIVSFGSLVSGAVVIKELGIGAPDLVLGRTMGMGAVGLFGRAMGLVQLFEKYVASSVKGIILPHFSSRHREGKALKDAYLHALCMTSGVAWPFLGFLALLAFPITRILYGDQWDAAIPLIKILTLYGAVNVLFYFSENTLLAVGAAKKNMLFELVRQPINITLVLGASFFGLEHVATALVLGAVVSFLISYRLLQPHIGLTWRDIASSTWKSVALCAISLIGPVIAVSVIPISAQSLWLPFMAAALSFCGGWLAGLAVLGHPLHDELKRGIAKARSALNNA